MAEKRARTETVTEIAPHVLLIDAVLEDPPHLSWHAGQFVSVRCGDAQAAHRAYSISCPPGRGDRLQLLVKLQPHGAGSEFFLALRPGDPIGFTGPMGFFGLEPAHPGDAVFCATGSGIAAALPMLEETIARLEEQDRVLLFWGVRSEDERYFGDRLAALAASPRYTQHTCVSRPGPSWTGERGRIVPHVLGALPGLEHPTFYLVGNGDMVKELKHALLAAGVGKHDIRQEVFSPAKKATASPS